MTYSWKKGMTIDEQMGKLARTCTLDKIEAHRYRYFKRGSYKRLVLCI